MSAVPFLTLRRHREFWCGMLLVAEPARRLQRHRLLVTTGLAELLTMCTQGMSCHLTITPSQTLVKSSTPLVIQTTGYFAMNDPHFCFTLPANGRNSASQNLRNLSVKGTTSRQVNFAVLGSWSLKPCRRLLLIRP